MSTTNNSALPTSSSTRSAAAINNLLVSASSSSSGLKRGRETEPERDGSLPNTKRHLRATLNTTLNAAALESKLAILQANCVDLEKKVREKDQRLDLLEKDRRWLHDRETEEREARERENKEAAEKETELKRQLSDARIALSNLEVSHTDLQESHLQLERSRAHEVSLLKTQLEEVQKQAVYLEARVEEEKNAARTRVSDIAIPSSLSQSTSSLPDSDHRLLTAELKRQASYSRQLESTNTRLSADLVVLKSENAALRERNATVEVLREDKRGLESRLRMKEEEIKKLVRKTEDLRRKAASSRRSSSVTSQLPLNPSTLAHHLGLEQDDPAGQTDKEDVAMQDESDALPTVQATSQLTSLRLEHAALLDAHGTTLAELTAVKRERDALREGASVYTELETEVTQSDRVEMSNMRIRLRLREEELQAALKELAFLETALTQLTSDTKSQPDSGTLPSLHEARVQQLEGLFSEAKRSNTGLRSEIDSLLEKLKQSSERVAQAETKALEQAKESKLMDEKSAGIVKEELTEVKAELQKEKEKREELEKSLDQVEQDLFDLRGEVAGGRHVPPNTRILEMKGNPHDEWETSRTAVLERLKGENQALLKRLAEVEEALKDAAASPAPAPTPVDASQHPNSTLVPKESLDLAVQEKEELENELKQREKRLLRLQQVFKAKSAEFREAIESIMGVKLAFYPNGQVRITSLFDLNASFVFSPDKTAKGHNAQTSHEGSGMNMQLVATGEGGPQDLPNMMRYWIETEGCLPGFIASVTLECYESSKRNKS
ncbi:hypothetical protein GYMLUDRAFT_34318 [Collybiopsis luxurians FD-317 M1]|nr:hypothetical protein GYMLUDRAFT_34318 [Collybiopsis luxurians FD-317 M1]